MEKFDWTKEICELMGINWGSLTQACLFRFFHVFKIRTALSSRYKVGSSGIFRGRFAGSPSLLQGIKFLQM